MDLETDLAGFLVRIGSAISGPAFRFCDSGGVVLASASEQTPAAEFGDDSEQSLVLVSGSVISAQFLVQFLGDFWQLRGLLRVSWGISATLINVAKIDSEGKVPRNCE